MKKILIFVVGVVACIVGYNKINANFSLDNIHLRSWPETKSPVTHSLEEVQLASSILNQQFRYLGKGRQCFVFESQDGNYILKFIKCQRINVTNLYETMKLPAFLEKKRKKKLKEREGRLTSLLSSMSLSYRPLQEQTGVLYLHIEPTEELQNKVVLIDRVGQHHSLDINQVPFILQKKAMQIMPVLKSLYKQKRMQELKERLNQLVDLFRERARYGVLCPDNAVFRHNNIGFIEDRAIYVDVGGFISSTKKKSEKRLKKDLSKLRPIARWLKKHDKKLAANFSSQLKELDNT